MTEQLYRKVYFSHSSYKLPFENKVKSFTLSKLFSIFATTINKDL